MAYEKTIEERAEIEIDWGNRAEEDRKIKNLTRYSFLIVCPGDR